MTLDHEDPTTVLAIDLMAGHEPPEGEAYSTGTGIVYGVFETDPRLRYIRSENGELLDLIDPGEFRSVVELDQHLRWLNPEEDAPTGRGWE